MGERRWRAAQVAGLDTIPAIVRETQDQDLLRDALLENLHRAQLNPLEEAAAYAQMLEDFDCTQEELAARIKRSRPQISNTIRLLRLPPTVQRRVAAGVLSAGHARALLTLEDPAAQERLAQRVVAEGISVRAVEEIVAVGEHREPRRGANPYTAAPDPRAEELSRQLGDHLETRVRVEHGSRPRAGSIIEFATDRRTCRSALDELRYSPLSRDLTREIAITRNGTTSGVSPTLSDQVSVASARRRASRSSLASLARTSLVAERSATKDRNGTVPARAIRISRFQLQRARRPRSNAVMSRIMYSQPWGIAVHNTTVSLCQGPYFSGRPTQTRTTSRQPTT